MYHITALGEVLIDFTPGGTTADGIMLYQRNPGGAPANVLAMASRLGCSTAFIGKVGSDSFGDYLRDVLSSKGIDVSGLVVDAHVPTTLAFVDIDAKGDRSFSFYRKPGADMMLQASEVSFARIAESQIFHFGSLSLVEGPCREATEMATAQARKAGLVVSYDPNYRPLLWPSPEAARTAILRAVPWANVLKVSEEEATLLTRETALPQAAEALAGMGPKCVLITCGRQGVYAHTPSMRGHIPAFAVQAVDTTGAGDAFMGTVLARLALASMLPENLDAEHWHETLEMACAAGSLAATRKGAINAMPDAEAIAECRSTVERT